MSCYWITFKDGQADAVCVALNDNNRTRARRVAEEYSKVAVDKVYELPYPADLVILNEPKIPNFCHHGNICAGRTSCPRELACND